ncbi:hypothetical protein AYJ70_28560 [Pseudomonas monteilii]|uniref:Uncharacterized protein n=1 Tax=Pseudomonas monteilii TaxID=76759 RepID=A0AAP7FIT4_9PSED|nr:hypothetical protein AYJ70_28560 [Pseudomonas monteilii]RNF69057.1 hypothetical protein EFJ98_18375 [Pseudomonas putida]
MTDNSLVQLSLQTQKQRVQNEQLILQNQQLLNDISKQYESVKTLLKSVSKKHLALLDLEKTIRKHKNSTAQNAAISSQSVKIVLAISLISLATHLLIITMR